jgi:hypothetical protein
MSDINNQLPKDVTSASVDRVLANQINWAREWLQYRHGSHPPTSLSARDRQQSNAVSFSDVSEGTDLTSRVSKQSTGMALAFAPSR